MNESGTGKSGDNKSNFFDRLTSMRLDQVSLQPLSQATANQVAALIRRNLDSFAEAGTVMASIHRRLLHFWETYAAEGSLYITAHEPLTDGIVGGAGIGPLAGLPPEEGVCEIRELVIDSSYRGRGIGRRLLHQVLLATKELGYRRVYLETTPQMLRARKLFQHFGFRPVEDKSQARSSKQGGELPCYYLLEDVDAELRNLPPETLAESVRAIVSRLSFGKARADSESSMPRRIR